MAGDRSQSLEPEFAFGFRRVFAFLVDHFSVGFLSYSIAALVDWVDGYSLGGFLSVVQASSSDAVPGSVATWWMTLLLGTMYFTLAEWKLGWTIGKLFLGLHTVNTNFRGLNLWQAFLRNVLKYPEFAFAALFFLILLIAGGSRIGGPSRIFGPPPRQRWGDQLAGTYVIRGPWKPVLVNSTRPASSKRDSAFMPVRYSADGSTGIRLSGRNPKK